ncbi:PadR family transcriptional regulator [Dietzia sp. PP-33]|jgi:PadR family transcriptional regulator PadR|uniref:PadR family transcriptional regulator n=1 Tax=Dietzia sp. PP-33 TaxID=2957500 RepID=UPI0029BBE469|nr:PadR family transcriptional regulator [Dietzia sp. PP-33]MDX2357758.1 PadR family transcriptional regulator [Dietzia sp. PP-33]
MDDESPAVLNTHLQEIRRGSVVLASLLACRSPRYGYALLTTLAEAGIATEANTLYPLLRRLESQGLLTSTWHTDDPRPRKYYETTELGTRTAERLHSDWLALGAGFAELRKADA